MHAKFAAITILCNISALLSFIVDFDFEASVDSQKSNVWGLLAANLSWVIMFEIPSSAQNIFNPVTAYPTVFVEYFSHGTH